MKLCVNGISLFFEVRGEGPPLLLLHGNGETHGIFKAAAARLARYYTVYALDTRGHGKSARVEMLHYTDMMEDVAAFIRTVRLQKPLLYGFSDGGIVGLLLACNYPDLLGKLIVSSPNLYPQGMQDKALRIIRLVYRLTRSEKYRLMLEEPDITPEQLACINVPTLVFAGEKDMVKEEHLRTIAENIPRARLKILPGESHGSYVVNRARLADRLLEFFCEES